VVDVVVALVVALERRRPRPLRVERRRLGVLGEREGHRVPPAVIGRQRTIATTPQCIAAGSFASRSDSRAASRRMDGSGSLGAASARTGSASWGHPRYAAPRTAAPRTVGSGSPSAFL